MSPVVANRRGRTRSLAALAFGAATLATLARCDAPTSPAPPATMLAFTSDPADLVGQGQTHRYTFGDGTWYAKADAIASDAASSPSRVVVFFNSAAGESWSLRLRARPGQPLAVGTYDAAVEYFDQAPTTPGLEFSGNGRGCTALTGRFSISELAFGANGTVNRLHATFEQHCAETSPGLRGEVTIAADPWR